jgi:N-acetylneuraminate synthase
VPSAPFLMPRCKSVDIDTLEDFEYAQWLLERRAARPAPAAPAVFVIAEAGVNHNGDLSLALGLCDAARAAGADAVKFQTFRAEDLVLPGAPTASYQARETGEQDQFALLRKLELSHDQHQAIQAHCKKIGIEFFSTPFSVQAIDLLADLGVARIKLSSGELTHRQLVEHAAATRLPLLVSTGMATMAEIGEALQWIFALRGDLDGVTVLHCTSAYPADDSALVLNAIPSMRRDLGLPIGYSDHSLGSAGAVAAVALGATVIEKHLTLDRGLPGPDHKASLEPGEFKRMVDDIRRVAAMLGDGIKSPGPQEADTARVARRSVVAMVDIAAGEAVQASMLACRRPATGIAPRDLQLVIGRVARVPIAAGSVLHWSDLEGGPPE